MWISESGSAEPRRATNDKRSGKPVPSRAVFWPMVFSLLVVLTGCSAGPEDEQARALQAIEQARKAGAAEYAGSAFTRATDQLALATAELETQESKKLGFLRRFGKSKELFASTAELAGAAAAEATAEKERINRELDALAVDLEARVEKSLQIVDGDSWALFRDRSNDPGAMMELEDELTALDDARREMEGAIAGGEGERALRIGRAALDQMKTLETLIDETSKTGKVSFRFEK